MENPKPETIHRTEPKTGPGRLLRQARQDLRLAPEDVAQILHLSSKQITALEKDDYAHLPGPTYVRGYLRSYAQLLGLAPEKVIESYNDLMIPAQPLAPPQSAPPPQATSSDHVVKAASLGVALVVLGLVYLWWQSESDFSNPSPGAAPSRPVERLPAETTTAPVIRDSAKLAEGEAVLPSGTPGVPPVTAAPGSGTASSSLTVSGMTLNLDPAEAPRPVSPPTPTPDRPVTRTRRVVEAPPDVPRSRMVLHAVQESWADIRDAQDNRLLYENVPAGRQVSIEGIAPFSVFVGNADGVRVEFNGKPYDVSKHKRGQVARFTLGGETTVNN